MYAYSLSQLPRKALYLRSMSEYFLIPPLVIFFLYPIFGQGNFSFIHYYVLFVRSFAGDCRLACLEHDWCLAVAVSDDGGEKLQCRLSDRVPEAHRLVDMNNTTFIYWEGNSLEIQPKPHPSIRSKQTNTHTRNCLCLTDPIA